MRGRGTRCSACGVGVWCEARVALRDLEQVYTAFSAREVLLHETRQRQKPIYLPRYLSGPSNAQAQGGRPRGAEPRGATSVRAAVCTAGSLRTRPVPSSFSRSASRRRARTGDSWCCMLMTRPPAPAPSGGACTGPRNSCYQGPERSGCTRGVVDMVKGRLNWMKKNRRRERASTRRRRTSASTSAERAIARSAQMRWTRRCRQAWRSSREHR